MAELLRTKSDVIQTLNRIGRRSPILHRLWGLARWYTTPSGVEQIADWLGHVGWTVECPCCGWRGRAFYRYPRRHGRPNATCPKCGAMERHRLLHLYFWQHADLYSKPIRVLEIAPGRYCHLLFPRLPNFSYITLDHSSSNVMCRGGLTSLPFKSSSFDLVICYHVLDHVVDDLRAMGELRRMLRDGGFCLVQVPIKGESTYEDPTITAPQERLQAFGQGDHVRIYGRDVLDRLRSAGFVVGVDSYVDALPKQLIRRHGLVRNEQMYVCHLADGVDEDSQVVH